MNIAQAQQLLLELEQELKQQGYWQETKPEAAAFFSTAPFFMDTMSGYEWLQWVLIPKLSAILAEKRALNAEFALYPYFQEALSPQDCDQKLHQLIKALDRSIQSESKSLKTEETKNRQG